MTTDWQGHLILKPVTCSGRTAAPQLGNNVHLYENGESLHKNVANAKQTGL